MLSFAAAIETVDAFGTGRVELELGGSVAVILEQLRGAKSLEGYMKHAFPLAEALAGLYYKRLLPAYVQPAEEARPPEVVPEDEATVPETASPAAATPPPARAIERTICDLLHCLIILCAETESTEEDEHSNGCLARCQEVRKALHSSLIAQLCEAFVRRGVSGGEEDAARREAVEYSMILARAVGTFDDQYWLRAVRIGCETVERPSIRNLALTAFGIMSQQKLRLGRRTTAVKLTREIGLVISAVLDIINDPEDFQSSVSSIANYVSSVLLRLLADDERSADDEVSWSTLLSQLLDCRIASDDSDEVYSALVFLNLLFSASPDEFLGYVSSQALVLRIAPIACKETGGASLRTQLEASEFLINCADFPSLRSLLIKGDYIDLLSPMLDKADDPELQSLVLAIIAKLTLHADDVRELVWDTVPFWAVVSRLCGHLEELDKSIKEREATVPKSKATDQLTAEQLHTLAAANVNQKRVERISRCLLITLSSLSFHMDFKGHILGLSIEEINVIESEYKGGPEGDQGTASFPLVKPGSELDQLSDKMLTKALDHQTTINQLHLLLKLCPASAYFHIVLLVFNLVRSKADKRAIRKKPGQAGPDFDEGQLKELEMMYEKMPEHAKVQERMVYNSGGLVLATAVRKLLLKTDTVIPLVNKIVLDKQATTKGKANTLLTLAAHTVTYLSSIIASRPRLIAQGGIQTALRLLDVDPDARDAKFTLATLLASSRPEGYGYKTRMNCAHHLVKLIEEEQQDELYVNFACRALVNLTSTHEDVCIKVWNNGNGWRLLEGVLSDWSDTTSAFAAEVLCNISSKEFVQNAADDLCGDKRMPWTFALLLAYATDDDVPARMLACQAVMSYLSSGKHIALFLGLGEVSMNNKAISILDRLLELWNRSVATKLVPSQQRLSVVIRNVLLNMVVSNPEGKADNPAYVMCQKVVLATSMVWDGLDAGAKNVLNQLAELPTDAKQLFKVLLARMPPPIAQLWLRILGA